ncbi:MAG: 2-hydroxyacid dehydrogenase [Flammeovirgaceae bacterium]
MKIAIYSAHKFELEQVKKANAGKHKIKLIDTYLTEDTVILARSCDCVALFANDDASAKVLEKLREIGVKYIALRSAGYNHVDLKKAKELGLKVANVPEYSPYSVAEHAITLMLSLNRKIIRANSRIKELNFTLDGLTGFDMNGKTVGVVGTGKIGAVVAKILHGFGCNILAYDLVEDEELKSSYNVQYQSIEELCKQSDIITLHVPLNEHTKYLIDMEQINMMKKGVMLINTSRGGLVNTKAVIQALKTRHIGYLGLDVYEEEKGLFFEDHSDQDLLQDDVIARLLTFKNVLITSHQAFLTETALQNIADTTFYNINCWSDGKDSENELT